MAVLNKFQRIRDPIHNLIEFDTSDQFERTMWRLMQTQPFQRLRRVRQLGFSEFVFPGATHTRFSHSIGVFHLARELMKLINRSGLGRSHQADVALAAALLHDVGHGMFSHAFEDVGKRIGLTMAIHENVSDALIRHNHISDILGKELGKSFSEEVADVIRNKKPGNIYDSVVSSQFDADRLDYMQRDRMMTGVQGSGVDATWIMANLEVGSVTASSDEDSAGSIETLVLGPKAFHAAEHYVLSLFQLYPNVYLHKTTRGAEKLFSCLMIRIFELIQGGHLAKAGLPKRHPICEFFADSKNLDRALALDDAVFWGALPLLKEADDRLVSECAIRLQERRLMKCIDIRRRIEGGFPVKPGSSDADRREREAKISLKMKNVMKSIQAISSGRSADEKQIFVDSYKRSPYKKFKESQSLFNQILIRQESGIEDMAHLSSVVSGADSFEVNRVYLCSDDAAGRAAVDQILNG